MRPVTPTNANRQSQPTKRKQMAILKIPCTKGKAMFELDTDNIPQHVYEAMLYAGAKEFLNKGMSKITTAKLEGEELEKAQAAANAQAEKNLKAIVDGTIKLPGVKAPSKVSGVVKTEAMRIARNLIKDTLKAQGKRPSTIPASVITDLAKKLLDADPEIIKEAEANVAARTKLKVTIDLSGVQEDAKLAATADARKKAAKGSGTLSAKQAGKVAPRSKKAPAQAQA